jgi:DNA helicase-2/ATP-dependent DNA helicase PcrA
MTTMDLLADLNSDQRRAVETIEGPLLIVAGPGSGKTRVIVHRIAYLVKVCGINPRHIMAVTFTNKAAREMRERAGDLLARSAESLTLGTFHATCCGILRREGKHIGLDPRFAIYDDDDQQNLVKRCMQELAIDSKRYAPRAILSAISNAKSQLIGPEDYGSHSYFEEIVRRIYEYYQQLLHESRAQDFDDLIMSAVSLFRNHPKVLAKYQSRYVHLLVDEFQDTNVAQYELTKLLAGKYRNVCVVGDPDQSIYSWRNADLRNILSFEEDYPDANVVHLGQNYRSTQTILEAAQNVIVANRHRKEQELWTQNDTGVPIVMAEAYNEAEEAQLVMSEVERLVGQEGTSFHNCAVMYRTNAQSRVIEEVCLRYGMPYQLVGTLRFYERREVKDIIAYLRLIQNPYDSVSLARIINVPGRGIGQRTLGELSTWAKSQGIPLFTAIERAAKGGEEAPLSKRAVQALGAFYELVQRLIPKQEELNVIDLVGLLLQETGYRDYLLDMDDGEERWDNILELLSVAQEHRHLKPRESLAAFLERVALVSDVDGMDDKKDAVTLITLHQAKGLEFPVVFMVGMEDGVLPHFRSFSDPSQMEEERRLCYVGMTRAQERLYLFRAQRRMLMGGSNANPPSAYLQDIPSHLVEFVGPSSGEWGWGAPSIYGREQSAGEPVPAYDGDALIVGQHVYHATFGEGVVVSCTRVRDDHEVVVAFDGVGVKKLLASLTTLERRN